MKKLFFIFAFILLITSCKKEKNEDKFLTFMTAGQTEGIGINYVDIVPDEKIAGGYTIKYLDLNNDSIDDFKLIYVDQALMPSTYANYLTITPLGENSVCVSKTKTDWVQPLAYGDTIGTNNNWSNSEAYLFKYRRYVYLDTATGQFVSTGDPIGDFYDHDNIYMGVRIVNDGKQIFSWIDIKKNVFRRYAITVPY